ncbi:MAG: DUF4038 domain-containing protein [Opitutales bacterium]
MAQLPALSVSADGHFFQTEDGQPFFLLADTVWLLFNKMDEAGVRRLFENRASKGFTVILSVIFRDLFTPNTPNVYGDPPFASEADMHAVKLNPAWMEHVRRVVQRAQEYGLFMGLLPTWGDKWNEHSNSAGPVIMDAAKAHAYGRTLSDALGDCPNILWVLGGDSPIQTQAHANIVHAMATGIRSGASAERLMTFHPNDVSVSDVFHTADWLDFNSMQSGHARPNIADYRTIEHLYRLSPPKPCLNMEANFEGCPMFLMLQEKDCPAEEPLYSAYDVRKCLYRSVLAGGAGFTYGCEPIRQVFRKGDRVHVYGRYGEKMPAWEAALDAPGSAQMEHLVKILQQRSYFTRVPAQELVLPLKKFLGVGKDYSQQENRDSAAHIRAARCREGRYILAYTPVKQPVCLDTSPLNGEVLAVSLFDPETGERTSHYDYTNTGTFTVVPHRDLDTLLVLDAKSS